MRTQNSWTGTPARRPASLGVPRRGRRSGRGGETAAPAPAVASWCRPLWGAQPCGRWHWPRVGPQPQPPKPNDCTCSSPHSEPGPLLGPSATEQRSAGGVCVAALVAVALAPPTRAQTHPETAPSKRPTTGDAGGPPEERGADGVCCVALVAVVLEHQAAVEGRRVEGIVLVGVGRVQRVRHVWVREERGCGRTCAPRVCGDVFGVGLSRRVRACTDTWVHAHAHACTRVHASAGSPCTGGFRTGRAPGCMQLFKAPSPADTRNDCRSVRSTAPSSPLASARATRVMVSRITGPPAPCALSLPTWRGRGGVARSERGAGAARRAGLSVGGRRARARICKGLSLAFSSDLFPLDVTS